MTHASPETAATEAPADLSAFVESERRRADVVGVSYAAFNRDGVAYAGAFGHADLDRGERVTTDTRFRAASISKLFTTTLVFQEIEAGRIGLDDSVNRHLDEPARLRRKGGGDADDVTIRHLLTHTSGLPVSWRGIEYDRRLYTAIANESLRTFSDLSTLVAGQRTVRPPGRRLVYSNGAFNLLGYLVQRLNGEPFADLVHDRVLAPLGMHSSGFPAEAGGPGVATPYGGVMTGAGRKPAPKVRNHSGPAGALITTAN
ncbi:MAG: serine hydrolase domain-containing protein, partial [Dehalococcoidia bacterium]